MTRLMVAVDRDDNPFHFEIDDDERVHITQAGNVRVRGGESSITQPMEVPAVVVYELVEEARA